MLDKSCNIFIDELASSAPVPGGGSASALTAAIGMALGSMVGELTTGKKGYEQYENEISELLFKSGELINEFRHLVRLDIESFSKLSEAYKIPKGTEEENLYRIEKIQNALHSAAQAPIMIVEACLKALKLLDSYSLIGNKNLITDAGTGTALCLAALKGARLNALINIKSMKDPELKAALYRQLNTSTDAGEHLAKITYDRVEKACF